jgi:lipopolysaccharide export LptBFGC system permease protein LptF
MKILDRYIARQFLLNFALLMGSLLTIIMIIDLSLNFDEYAEIGAKIVAASGGTKFITTLGVFWNLWWPRLFQLIGFLMGLGLVAAMGFTCAQMVKHRELIAALAGGLSMMRIARPMLIVACILTALQIVNRELLVPSLAPLLVRDKRQAGSTTLGVMYQPLCTDGAGKLFYARGVNLDTNTIEGLYVWERDEAGLATHRITADSATWRDGAWQLTNGQKRDVSTRLATGHQPPAVAIDRVDTDLDPVSLKIRRFEGFSHNLSCAQINDLVDRFNSLPNPPERRIEELLRAKWGRFGLLATNLLALVLCLPFFLRREPCNMVVQSLKGAPMALGAIGIGFVCAVTTIPGLSPQVSVFVPALVLAPLCIAAVSNIRT